MRQHTRFISHGLSGPNDIKSGLDGGCGMKEDGRQSLSHGQRDEKRASSEQDAKGIHPSNGRGASSRSDTAKKPSVILTSDDVGTRSTPPTEPAPSTSQATGSRIEPRTIASHRCFETPSGLSKTPGLETSRMSNTVRVLHGNVERLGDAQERKVK
jgi:hypothetical protein